MMAAAVGGSFLIGGKTLDTQAFMRRFAAVVAIGLAFTYFGIVRYAGTQIEKIWQFADGSAKPKGSS